MPEAVDYFRIQNLLHLYSEAVDLGDFDRGGLFVRLLGAGVLGTQRPASHWILTTDRDEGQPRRRVPRGDLCHHERPHAGHGQHEARTVQQNRRSGNQ